MMLKKSASKKALLPEAARPRVGRPSSYKREYTKMAKHDHHGYRDPNGRK
jgi:hypothetical protein